MTSAALHDIVATIRAHVDACLEFTTSELRPVVLAMLEERHPQVLEVGFTASLNWLNDLMRDKMILPMRTISTHRVSAPISGSDHGAVLNCIPLWRFSSIFFVCVCAPPTDDMEVKHRLVLLCMAYLLDLYKIPPGLVMSRDQSCDLQKIGLLPGHAGYLLQQVRKLEVPNRAAKQPRVEAAGNSRSGARTPGRPGAPGARGPAPAPSLKASPQAGFFCWQVCHVQAVPWGCCTCKSDQDARQWSV